MRDKTTCLDELVALGDAGVHEINDAVGAGRVRRVHDGRKVARDQVARELLEGRNLGIEPICELFQRVCVCTCMCVSECVCVCVSRGSRS